MRTSLLVGIAAAVLAVGGTAAYLATREDEPAKPPRPRIDEATRKAADHAIESDLNEPTDEDYYGLDDDHDAAPEDEPTPVEKDDKAPPDAAPDDFDDVQL